MVSQGFACNTSLRTATECIYWEDARLIVVSTLRLAGVGKQPRNFGDGHPGRPLGFCGME